ncbi:MAG: hypothetical protein D6714_00700 [Bacteroidetes bacterium]|nr:MAG: hypothetical protein D6714_00700 [Bacteroidota bacterium]
MGVGYFPKWTQPHTQATLSWDVSGYYFYLPAFFIYGDPKKLAFKDEILEKYLPTWNDFQQGWLDEPSGNYVMKYSSGMAIMYAPAFAIAHQVAKASTRWPADGFSRPYQLAIGLESLLVALLGLWFLRKILRVYFGEWPTAAALVAIVFGTNFLNYSAISGAMTHNYLFALYAVLIWRTILFYQKPTSLNAACIGALVGLMALTRPTEILSALIPLLWGMEGWKSRLGFIQKHAGKYALAAATTLAVGSVQLMYWKWVTGRWLVYSYEDQGFSWLHPHLMDGIFSYKSGWLVYSPILIFALAGFWFLYRTRRTLFPAIFTFFVLFTYVTFAWDEWLYGGSLGQRAMVQSYAVLAFPMAAFAEYALRKGRLKWFFGVAILLFSYYNLWLTHQAHKGGLLKVGQMTGAYFWKILGKYDVPREAEKLLDTEEVFWGDPVGKTLIYENNFETDTLPGGCPFPPIEGRQSLCLTPEHSGSPLFSIPLKPDGFDWVRAEITAQIGKREDNIWKMTEFHLRLKRGNQTIKDHKIRLQRLLDWGGRARLFHDLRLSSDADRLDIYFTNNNSNKPILLDEMRVFLFREKN